MNKSPGVVNVSMQKPKAEKTAVSEALRAELVKILTDGSKEDDGAITPEVLSRVVRVAKTGRDVIVAMAASPQNLASLIKRKRMPWGGVGLDIPDELIEQADGDDLGGGYGGFGIPALAPSPVGENFGMTALRELIAGAKQVSQSPDRLVEALAVARREKLDDVAKRLEEQLGLKPNDPLPPTEPTVLASVKILIGDDPNTPPDVPGQGVVT